MTEQIIFTTIKSPKNNTKLEKDENGYYRVHLGAVNCTNSSGAYYTSKGVRGLIEDTSSGLHRALKQGMLKGEADHPEWLPGMSKAQFYNRNMNVKTQKSSHHIREVMLTQTNESSGVPGGGNIILIEGWVKPSGPYGEGLKLALDNPDENVAFSVRSFTKDTIVGDITHKRIINIITWDWVTEPGISVATKWSKLGIESRDVCSMDIAEMVGADGNIAECFNCSVENKTTRDLILETVSNARKSKHNNVLDNW